MDPKKQKKRLTPPKGAKRIGAVGQRRRNAQNQKGKDRLSSTGRKPRRS